MQETQQDEFVTNTNEDIKTAVPGQLYCIHNEMYKYYGDNVFKIGESGDVKKRMFSYSTPYIEDVVIKHQTKTVRNKKLAESILFRLLCDYRIKSSREFFNCELEIIKDNMNKVVDLFDSHTDEQLMNMYFPKKLRQTKVSKKNTSFIEYMFDNDNITKEELVEARDVSKDKINELIRKYKNYTCEQTDKVLIARHMFKEHWKLDEKGVVFDVQFIEKYYSKSSILTNLRSLHEVNKESKQDEKEAEITLDIIKKLGFCIDNMDIEVSRDDFIINMDKVMKENLLFCEWENYRYMVNVKANRLNDLKNNYDVRNFMGLINSVLLKYGINISSIAKNYSSKIMNNKKITTYKTSYKCNYVDNLIKYL